MGKFLIVGCGDIGTSVGIALLRDGHEVVGLKRKPPTETYGINYLQVDICDSADLVDLQTDFNQVVVVVAPSNNDEKSYQKLFIDGVNNLLNLFFQKKPDTPFIFISSTNVYGQRNGEWVDENSQTEPNNFRGKTVLEAEKLVLLQNSNNTVIRFSGIYGQGRNYLIDFAAKGPEVQHDPPYFTNRIHRNDCVNIIKFIIDLKLTGQKPEQIYLGSDDNPAPLWEIVSWLAKRLKAPLPTEKNLIPNISQNKRCLNKRIKKLGYIFKYPDYLHGYKNVS